MLPQVKSLVGDIGSIIAPLRRMINYHGSWTHRLPPEMLVEVGSHLKDDVSLITVTHVCHLWRTALLSSPRLWSHLDFSNEERALVFLERSKSGPLRVDLTSADDPSEVVRETLRETTTRMTMLRTEHDSFLDELLARSMPILATLEITESYDIIEDGKPVQCLPALTFFVISDSDRLRFHTPLLTSFHLTDGPNSGFMKWTTGIVLNFLRNCPLLEIAFFSCSIYPNSDDVVSLPLLHSFTHETPRDKYQLCLFNQIALPSTCRVVLGIEVTDHYHNPWIPGLSTFKDSSYLSDIRTVKIAAYSHNLDVSEDHITFKIELVNSAHRAISFDRISYADEDPSLFSLQGFLDILDRLEIDSVETLCFDSYPAHNHHWHTLPQVTPESVTQVLRKFRNLKTLILIGGDITLYLDGLFSCPTVDTLVVYPTHFTSEAGNMSRVEELVVSRKRAGSPLSVLTVILPFAQRWPLELERLASRVGRVQFL